MFFGSAACGCTSLLPSSCAIASAVVTPSCIALCATQVGEETSELDPDRARADDQQVGRHLRWSHRMPVGPDALAVGLGERQIARPRARCDDDVLCGELGRLSVRAGDAELSFGGELAL